MSGTVDTAPVADEAPDASGEAVERGLFRRLVSNPVGFLSITWLSFVALLAVFGQWIAPHDPGETNPREALVPPFDGTYWLGTDDAGRDVLSRLIAATQTNTLAVVITVLVAASIGVTSGLIAGYFLGWFDQVSNWVINLIMAMPGLVVLLAARTVVGPSILWAMTIFGVLIAPSFYRLVSQAVRSVRNELFVDAARVSGISDRRIIGRHVLRVVRGPIIIQAAIVSSISIAITAGLALIGFGEVNNASWGTMLQAGFSRIFRTRWLVLWPALAVSFTSLSFALLGSLLRDELEGGSRAGAQSKRKKQKRMTPAAAGTDADGGPGAGVTSTTIVHGTPPTDLLLSVRDLVVSYPGLARGELVDVVRGVDLDVGRAEILGLVGESGSGKTQTAFAVMGLLSIGGEIRRGSIQFDGDELVGDHKLIESVRGRRISYIPQEPMSNLDPTFTVGSQLVEPLRVCLGMDKAAAKQRALELLDRVHIPNRERVFDSYPHQLSGGMAQRVLIAGAVSSEPDLLIADEPTTALDVTVQAEILDLLREIQRDLNTSLILVTHNFGVVADIAERVAVMQHGQIVESGPVRDIFRQAEHPYTQSLMDAILDNHPARAPYEAVTS